MPTSSNYYIVYIGSSHFQKTLHAILTPVIMKLMIIKIDFEQKFKKKLLKKEDKYFYMFCNNGSQEVLK